MVKNINKDTLFLSKKSEDATPDDIDVANDLIDTLKFNSIKCVGMAANMIGVNKRIIAFYNDDEIVVMFNPKIIKEEDPYEAEEGCLSLLGVRKAKRFKKIKVEYYNSCFLKRIITLSGFEAQIVQHEIDHLEGILI